MKEFFTTILLLSMCGCATKTNLKEAKTNGEIEKREAIFRHEQGEQDEILVMFPNQAILAEVEAGRVWYLLLKRDGKIEKHLAVLAPPEYGANTLFSFIPGKMADFNNVYAIILSHNATYFTNAKGEMHLCQKMEEIDWKQNGSLLLKTVAKIEEGLELKKLKEVFEKGNDEFEDWQKINSKLSSLQSFQAEEYKFPVLGVRLTPWEIAARLRTTKGRYEARIGAIIGIYGGNLAEELKKEIKQLQEKIASIDLAIEEVKKFILRTEKK